MPESGVKFCTYDLAKSLVCSDPRHPRVHERLLSGACAGAASCVVIYPLEVAKVSAREARGSHAARGAH
jgi:hypothetical protein